MFNAPNRGKAKPGYGRILTFALGGTATLTARAFGHTEPPMPAITMNASPETVHEGKLLYGEHCAGVMAGRRRRPVARSPLRDQDSCTSSSRRSCLGGARAVARHAVLQGSPEPRHRSRRSRPMYFHARRRAPAHRRNEPSAGHQRSSMRRPLRGRREEWRPRKCA